MSPDFVKSDIPNSKTPRLAGRSSGDFAELEITIKNGILTPVPYVELYPFISKLSVKEGDFEGIDIGEWGGIVRFSPQNAALYESKFRFCPFCGSSEEFCCLLRKLQPVEENIFGDVFEGVDFLKYCGIGILRFIPRNNVSAFGVVGENCRGLYA